MKNKMMEELFTLAIAAIEETEDYVSIQFGNCGYLCHIEIMEGGFQKEKEYDGWYGFVSGNSELEIRMREEEFPKAKEHLKRLIARARKNSMEVAV